VISDEKYLTVKETATKLGLKPWQIHRAIARGLIPFYTFYTRRKLLLESEVRAVVSGSRIGGAT
jgi:hypothetical protein